MVTGFVDDFDSGDAAGPVTASSPALRLTDSARSALVGAGGKMVDGSEEVWADNIPLAARRAGGAEAGPHQIDSLYARFLSVGVCAVGELASAAANHLLK